MKVTKSIIAVLLCLSAGSAYADCEYYLTGNKETLNISDCVDGVKGIANSALSNSQNAQNVANGAASTAQNAQSVANTAASTAQNAQTAANKAQTAANKAQTTANEANSAAQNALNTANTAQNTANSANTVAQNAQSTANQAIGMRQKELKRQKRTQTTIQTIKLLMPKMNSIRILIVRKMTRSIRRTTTPTAKSVTRRQN